MAAAEPPRHPKALLTGSSASDSRRRSDQSLGSGSQESLRARSSTDAPATKPLRENIRYPRKAEPNRWETALQEISEISPDPATAVPKLVAVDKKKVSHWEEVGRPVRSTTVSEIQPLPEEKDVSQPKAPWREVGQPTNISQAIEQQAPPRILSGKLSEAFSPPAGKPARQSAQTEGSKTVSKKEKAAPSQGRAMSLLLTTMPDITDIGFRGGINLCQEAVKRLTLREAKAQG